MDAPASKRLLVVAILIFTVGVALCANYNTSVCNGQVVSTCLQPLRDVEYPVGKAVVPYMDRETLEDHCRRYDMFEVCMQNVRPYCTRTDQLIYRGIESAYQWICEDGFDEYFSYQKCFENTELHMEGDQCNNTLTQSLQKVTTIQHDNNYKKSRICLYVKQYFDCVGNIVEAFCGSKASLWLRTLDERSMFPLLEAIDCHITTTISTYHSNWIQITISIVITLSMLIILMSVLILFMQRWKRRQQMSSPNVAFPTAPPPYEEPGPFIVYDGQVATATQADPGQVPVKVNPSQGASPDDEAVAAGYFSASASALPGDHVPEDDSKKQAANTETVTKNESGADNSADAKTFKTYEETTLEVGNISKPVYEELGALGYFGTTPSAQNDDK